VDLFEYAGEHAMDHERPLAERMRPTSLKTFIGQADVVGPGTAIRTAIENDRVFSMVLWGPPGCGKTTLARIIARETRSYFVEFSAVLSGVKEIRSVIADAKLQLHHHRRRTILFVDEIHRFNKAQQDAFLHHVESGLITLIGATTENPSFEVIPALLSRCRVITMTSLAEDEMRRILDQALADNDNGLGRLPMEIDGAALNHLIRAADGDVRFALNGLEIAADMLPESADSGAAGPGRIAVEDMERALQRRAPLYDKSGEAHYNLISAFHKSMRGSDPDASLYWLVRMLRGGEDPLYIARRMVRFASEDVGNADPFALSVVMNASEAYRFLGSPEGELALAQAALYLATAPKSNRIYTALKKADAVVDRTGSLQVPLHIRNAPTRLMKELGYGKGYRYDHDYDDAHAPQQYLPDGINTERFYEPSDFGFERKIRQRLEHLRKRDSRPGTAASDAGPRQ
jgi:putative ATPase